MHNHEWHFFDFGGKKTISNLIDQRTYDIGDGKRSNGKNYKVVGKITGVTGRKSAILLAIEV